jgi:hypothetical protein
VIVRRLVVGVIALLLVAQVVRNAAVAELSAIHPDAAAKLWVGHPSVEISQALVEIGLASRDRRPITGQIFALIDDGAVKAPLSPEPFLVRGVKEETAGDSRLAERAFAAAQWRDPRSLPAAYFLAQYYLRNGQPLKGLEETTLLARLTQGGLEAVAPFLADYARERSNWQYIRTTFRSQPGLEDEVLKVLSQDSRNADAVLALADKRHRKPDSPWLRTLLQRLVASGDYARAHSIWSSVGRGQADGQLLFDPSFSTPEPPPPFNWSLTTSTVGLAERQPGHRLHVIFYGNEDGVLASELLMLPAGTYRLQMQVVDAAVQPEALSWSVRCDRSKDAFASAPIGQAASRSLVFQIPANCPAQWLELWGRSGDIAQQSEATIAGFGLTRIGPNA